MVVLGILGTVVTSVMLGQQRFLHRTNEQMIVRRELRTAMSALPADLRGVSSVGGDLLDFDASSVSFRNVTGSSIVCAKTSSNSIDLPPVNATRGTLTSWVTPPLAGDSLYIVRTDSSGIVGDFWTAHRITTIATSPVLCPGSAFLDFSDAGKTRYRLTVTPALPDSVVVGSAMRFVRSTRYALTQQASGQWYLGRSEYAAGAWSTETPIAGPYLAPSSSGAGGVSLRFYDSTGVQVATTAGAAGVARVDVVLRAQGHGTSGPSGATTIVKDSVAFRVALRNRQ